MSKRLLLQFLLVATLFFCGTNQIMAQQAEIQKTIDSMVIMLPKQKEDSVKASTLMFIANMKLASAQHTGKWEEAIEWANKALLLSEKVKFKFGIGRCNWILGMSWMSRGNYAEALKHHFAALKASFQNGRKVLTYVSYFNIGDCYTHMGNYKEALHNYQLALAIGPQANARESIEHIPLKIGIVYAKMRMYDEALNWYNRVLDTKKEYVPEENVRIEIASAQIELENFDEALRNLQIVVLLFPEKLKQKTYTNYEGILGEFLLQLGETYFKIGTLTKGDKSTNANKEAINNLIKSVSLLGDGAGGKELQMKAYNLLKQAYEVINDYENALIFTNKYMSLKDSIYSKINYLKLADLKIQFESQKAAGEEKTRLAKILHDEEVFRQKMITEEKLKSEHHLSVERLNYEYKIAEERLAKRAAVAEEKAKHDNAIAMQIQHHKRVQFERKRRNNLLFLGSVTLTLISVLLYLLLSQRKIKKRAIEKAEAMHKMVELEMQSLRSQLNPHFMFNSLNSIQELILMEENDKSHSYLSRFGKLLRMLLENAEKPFIPVGKEIGFIELYLTLENLRVPDLQYSILTDPNLNIEETLIPNMILQPYIENAIWHGLSHKAKDKQLQIRIYRENGTVNYEIEDNGLGRKKAEEVKSQFRQKHQSKGMELLSKRFKLLNEQYSSDIRTNITDVIKNNEVSGTLVTIKVPIKLSFPQFY